MPFVRALSIPLAVTLSLATPALACSVEGSAGGGLSGVVAAVGKAVGRVIGQPAKTSGTTAKAGPRTAGTGGASGLAGGGGSAGGAGGSFAALGGGASAMGLSGVGFGDIVASGAAGSPSAGRAFSTSAQDPDDRHGKLADASTTDARDVGFALAHPDERGVAAATNDVKVAALGDHESPRPEPLPVAMASPATESEDSVSFDREDGLPTSAPASRTGWLVGAALVGVGALGTCWAWRSLADPEDDAQPD